MSRITLAVDARMIRMSGIGVYLRHVLTDMVASHPDWTFLIYGDKKELELEGWSGGQNTHFFAFHAPIYSISAAISAPRLSPKPDILWTPHYNSPIFSPCPTVVTVHDVAHLALPDVFTRVSQRLYATAMLQNVRWRARGVIFVSHFSELDFLRLVGPPKGISEIIHNGLSPAWSKAGAYQAASAPYFLYVGNIKPHKNLPRLLAAYEKIMHEIPHDFILVGARTGFITGDSKVTDMVSQLAPRVRLTGAIDDEELRLLIANATALVHPSLYEGFGLPPLEAMACGCPTAVALAGALPEVCGSASLYFNPYDILDIARALIRLANEPALRARLVEAGYINARAYKWSNTASRTADFINSLITKCSLTNDI